MRPKKPAKADHDDLFAIRLDGLIDPRHELVQLADRIDWDWIEEELAPFFSDHGRPAEPVRFMIGMFLLKAIYSLSDEQVWARWVENPYFQYFTGEEFFRHIANRHNFDYICMDDLSSKIPQACVENSRHRGTDV